MSYELAKAYIQVVPTTKGIKGELESEMGSAGESAGNKFGSGFSSALGAAGKIAVGALATATAAIIGGTNALIDGVVAVAEYGNNIDKMSQKMGMSAEKYQEWDFIMQHCGSSIESMKAPMKTLATAAQTGSEAFTKLGLSQEEVANMSQEDLFEATITALQNVEDSTERTYLAGQLLGRGATELGPLLNMTAEETEAMAQQVHDLGGVMSDTAVKDAARFQDSLQNAQYAVTGLKNRMLSELLPGFADVLDGFAELVSGSEDGTEKIKKGVSNVMQSLNTMLPQAVDLISSILEGIIEAIPECAQTIVSMLPGIFDNVISMLTSLIPGILKILPELINAAMQLIVQLVGHLSEIITPIVKAIPTLIKSFVSGLLENLPALVSGVLELVVSLASELPSICNEIVEYIPQLFVQLAAAIVKCIPIIISSIGELVTGIISSLFGLEDPIKETGEKLRGLGDAARDGWAEISDAFDQDLDVSGLLSSMGNTSSEIQSEIDRMEGEITNIIATRLKEQSGLRAEDIEDIKNYQEQIKALEEEKLSIYSSQASAQLEIMRGITNGTAEEYAQRFALLQSADEQERAELETYYQQMYVDAENAHNAMLEEARLYLQENGGIEDEHYEQMLADAETAYTEAQAAADTYYSDRNAEISAREAEALEIMATANGSFIQDTTAAYDQAAAATADWQAESGELMSQYCSDAVVMQTAAGVTFGQLAKTLTDTDAKNAAAWLHMAAQAKSSGANLSGAAKDNALSILNAFENVPTDLEDDAHQMIEGMANGLEDEIPALKNSSQMTAEEIANTIKDYLQIRSPSRVMQDIGKNTIAGLTQGVSNASSSIQSEMQGVGRALIQGISIGIQSQQGELYRVAYNTVKSAVDAAKAAGEIKSPSRVMREEVGLMLSEGMALGLEDGKPMIMATIDEIGEGVNSAFREIDLMDGIREDAIDLPRSLTETASDTGRFIATATVDPNGDRNNRNENVQMQLLALLMKYLPDILKAIGAKQGLDPSELAALIAKPMSKELGKLERMYGRGICME